eukprot:PhF_6_TR8674/c0_g1_i1/m.13570
MKRFRCDEYENMPTQVASGISTTTHSSQQHDADEDRSNPARRTTLSILRNNNNANNNRNNAYTPSSSSCHVAQPLFAIVRFTLGDSTHLRLASWASSGGCGEDPLVLPFLSSSDPTAEQADCFEQVHLVIQELSCRGGLTSGVVPRGLAYTELLGRVAATVGSIGYGRPASSSSSWLYVQFIYQHALHVTSIV